jgi:hypothetical protein
MKHKDISAIMILFLLFIVLTFVTPFMETGIADNLWISFFGVVGLIVIIWILISLTSKENSIESFKGQPILLQILEIIFIASFIFEIITVQHVKIAGYILFLIFVIKLITWFFKKEE